MAIEAYKEKNLSSQINNAWVSKGIIAAYLKENSTSTSNNTSNIYVEAKIYTPSASWENTNGVSDVLRCYWHDNKDNTDVLKATWSGTSVGVGETKYASTTFNVTHKDDGTLSGYVWATWSRDGNNGYSPYSTDVATANTALTSIPRKATITTAPNFNDTGNPVLKYENKAGNSATTLQAGIYKTDGSTVLAAYRDITKTGTSYTFSLTTAERNAIRAATPNSNTLNVRFYVKTVIGSNTFYDYKQATVTIVDANPTFSNFTYRDGNSTTTAVTGNDQYIIQNKSSLIAEISTANKATANKSATMSSYVFEISSYSGTENYTTSAISKTIGTVNATANQNLKITARDSRGNTTAVSKTVNIVPYSSPSLTVSATRLNNFENNTTIKISGTASPLKVNNVAKNSVDATSGVQYRFKQASTTTWGSWTNVSSSYNTSTGAVSVSDFVVSFDNQVAWDLQFKIVDAFETKTFSIALSQGQPQFFVGADGRVAVGGVPSRALATGELGQLEVFGQYFGKEGVYAVNSAVSPDTTARWLELFGEGHFYIKYQTTGCFTNQPSQLGLLETWIQGNNVCQVWHTLANGVQLRRCGNNSGWSDGVGRWSRIEDYDNRAQTGVWSSICIKGNSGHADGNVTYYTKKGTALKFAIENGGSTFQMTGGAENIHILRHTASCDFSSATTSNYGITGCANDVTVWTYVSGGASDGSYFNASSRTSSTSSSGVAYANLAGTTSGSKMGTYFTYTAIREEGSTNVWDLLGKIHSRGSAVFVDFFTEIKAYGSGYVPAVYQRGVNQSTVSRYYHLVEVFED